MSDELSTTWDGLPISPEAPFGTTIVVYRRIYDRGQQAVEFLLLHRAHDGPEFEGEWAWTPPSGSRWPNEPVDDCARRELKEETSLTLAVQALDNEIVSWAIYHAEASADDVVTLLDVEHDRYEWVSLETAIARCLPEVVGEAVQRVARLLQ
jgi:8-oxo-dGTP pyrophosphatase MutT (NUDIX family)